MRVTVADKDSSWCALISRTCADVWGGQLAAVTIIVIKRFKMKQRKYLFEYLIQYQTHAGWFMNM